METEKQQHIIVSHADDLDGVASAILLYEYVKIKYSCYAKVRFANYDMADEIITSASKEATHLWISDLSIRNLDIVESLKKFNKDTLFIFDHHVDTTALIDAVQDNATIGFDISGEKCAADLIWEYAFPRVAGNSPEASADLEKSVLFFLVKATHSRDLWINNIPEGAELSKVIAMLGPDDTFIHLVEDLNRVQLENFTPIMRFCLNLSDDLLDKAKTIAQASVVSYLYRPDGPSGKAKGIKLFSAITMGAQSDVGHMFLEEHPMGIVGLINLDKMALSFRTSKEVVQKLGFGVNQIAGLFENGGGHTYAAGAPITKEMLLKGPEGLLNLMTTVINDKTKE